MARGVLGVLGVLGAAFLEAEGEKGVDEVPAPAAGEAAAEVAAVFFFFHL